MSSLRHILSGRNNANSYYMIKLTNISKIYPKNIVALDNVSLHIKPQEFVCLAGQSGAGKSTLIRLLTAEERPTQGKIKVLGWDVDLIKPRHIPLFRRKIGIVFQDFKLLPRKTVWENVAYALMVSDTPDKEIERMVPKVLEMVGLSRKQQQFPNELSAGEQQRVSIARALAHEPKLLLADEPTGNLDLIRALEITDILKRINKILGTTIILATHNKDVVNRLRKRVITLDNGVVIRDQEKGRYVI